MLLRRRLSWFTVLAALHVAAAMSACGGQANVEQSGEDAGDVPVESGVDALSGPESWCASQGQHTFCEDFSEGVPGKLSPQTSTGAHLSADTVDFQSAPQSMLAVTSAVADAGDESMGLAFRNANAPGASFQVQLDFEVGADCFANGDYDNVTIARVDYKADGYGLAFYVSPSQSAMGPVLSAGMYEIDYGADGGARYSYEGDYGYFPVHQWMTLTFAARLVGKMGSVGNFSVTPTQPPIAVGGGLFGPATSPSHPPTLFVGADVTNIHSLSSGCSVHVDNVLFDIMP